MRMRGLATALSALGFLWAVAATVYILGGGDPEGISTSFALTGGVDAAPAGVTLASASGVWVVGLLAAITLLAGTPLGVALSYPEGLRVTAWSAGALLLGFSVVTAPTVGLYYMPCAAALLVAAIATGRSGTDRRRGRA